MKASQTEKQANKPLTPCIGVIPKLVMEVVMGLGAGGVWGSKEAPHTYQDEKKKITTQKKIMHADNLTE